MVYRPAQVYNGSGWDDIGDKRMLTHDHSGGADGTNIPQSSVTDLTSDLASKVDYALPVNAQTGTTYTFVAADAEKLTTASNAAAVTLTIPPQSSVTWSDNTVLRVVNYGAGAVTIDGGSGVTVTNTSSTIAQYGAAVAIRTGSDAWTVVPFGGGDVPSATVSSPAATGQYTDTGITYDYYTFTASGTLTVDTAGFADVLVVGGGGGGATGGPSTRGAGGGAGGYIAETFYLSDGSLTITVGGGGGVANIGGTSRVASVAVAPGGGGGNSQPSGRALPGGSGGGGAPSAAIGFAGLGNDGGSSSTNTGGGGGGGAGAIGSTGAANTGGNGGNGLSSAITGTSVTRGGGGGGSGGGGGAGSGGSGGGGNGGQYSAAGQAGSTNTGGGGGGGGNSASGGAGGSGIVIVRVAV